MDLHRLVGTVLDENRDLLAKTPKEPVERLMQGVNQAERIFCGAQGRSGDILRCFCMRLMHLGYQAYFVGETITPRIGKGDILVVVSGSGETSLTHELVKLGRREGAATYGVIGVEDSLVSKAVDCAICLPGGSKMDYLNGSGSVQPPGSLFEQATFVLLETIVLALCKMRISDHQALLERHTNLE